VITTGQAWDRVIATYGSPPRLEAARLPDQPAQ
jgi:hypothetical protein